MPRIRLNQQTVLQAAIEIADKHTFEKVTLAALAQKLEVRTPALYNHVNGLPGLRNKLTIYGLDQLKGTMTNAAIGRSQDDAVWAISKAYLAFAREHPGLYEATQRSSDWQDEEVKKAGEELLELIFRVLNTFSLEDEVAIHTVRGFRSLLHGFASLEQQGGFAMPLDLDDSFSFLIETFLAGIHSCYPII